MPRCIFCNKFSFLLNEKRICKKCFAYYSAEATKVVEQDINALFRMIDAEYNPLDYRISKLDELENLYYNFLNTNAGQIFVMYDYFTSETIKTEISKSRLDFDNQKRRAEILKYSKVEATPSDYVVFDLETTGLNCESDAILEIGAIKYVNGIESERFHTYINPQRSIPRAASAINHITAAKVRNAPLVKSALVDFLLFIGDYPLIAYNSDFDMKFIQMKCTYNLGKKVQNDVIDALPLARKYLPQLPNKKLETIKQHFGLNVGSHNALDDCFVTNYLYQYCRQFEELKYRYIIPFSYNPQELSAREIDYLNVIIEILEKNGIDPKKLSMYFKSSLLVISNNTQQIIAVKLNGKLQYVLFEIPFAKFESEYQTIHKSTPSIKSEGDRTRVFLENPQQLWEFEALIAKK